jgi:hypothetical protein
MQTIAEKTRADQGLERFWRCFLAGNNFLYIGNYTCYSRQEGVKKDVIEPWNLDFKNM